MGAKTILAARSDARWPRAFGPARARPSLRLTRARPARGFTLIELVVVMAIIGIAAVIAVPAVQSGQHQREVRQTLQHFVATVREASGKAVLTRRTVEIWISTDDDTYALAVPLDKDAVEGEQELDDVEREQARKVIGKVDLPESASFGDVKGVRTLERDIVAIPFFPTGASGGGEIEFVFENDNNRKSYFITIDPLVSSIDLKDES